MEKLRRLRTERGLSQAKLAAQAELDPSTVNQIERGAREASPATLRKLAEALDVGIAELLEDVPPKASGRSSLEPSFNDVLDDERHAPSLRSWTTLIKRLANRWEEEISHWDQKDLSSRAKMMMYTYWVLEIISLRRDIASAILEDPNFINLAYSRGDVSELFSGLDQLDALTERAGSLIAVNDEAQAEAKDIPEKLAVVHDITQALRQQAQRKEST